MSDKKIKTERKLLENPVMSSLMVPIAIVLVGALLIFGVTKMLSTQQSYKDLVRELNSKTFGNRWISAFELSKLISTQQIPEEDIPWLIENLGNTFKTTQDPRTREFLIVALGAMRSPLALPILEKSINIKEGKIKFHTLVALGNIPKPIIFDWAPVKKMALSDDQGLAQSALLVLATHEVREGEEILVRSLSKYNKSFQYSAAMGLINFRNEKSAPLLKEILKLKASVKKGEGLIEQQVINLKLNVIDSLVRKKWNLLNSELENVATQDESLKVQAKCREALKILKN